MKNVSALALVLFALVSCCALAFVDRTPARQQDLISSQRDGRDYVVDVFYGGRPDGELQTASAVVARM